jgi:anti-anti-sigma factor
MQILKENGVVILRILPADLSEPRCMSEVMEKLLIEDGVRRIVADLSQVDTIYSMQIGTLVTMHVLCYENVAVMKLASANEKVKSLLRMVGLEAMMEMHHGAAVAAQSFGPPATENATPTLKRRGSGPSDPRLKTATRSPRPG